ncbi:hypothetical protein G5714_011371 [Onychostoma macrolepis]|uniref:Uncharacterized protein n=1 Tax=Onychostoma macrolepis TaxID=369639 RepID=A0A7J6CS55_9TELE|nr:hypothetical protein G5714_011371 [Onychostoma macrolepis]
MKRAQKCPECPTDAPRRSARRAQRAARNRDAAASVTREKTSSSGSDEDIGIRIRTNCNSFPCLSKRAAFCLRDATRRNAQVMKSRSRANPAAAAGCSDASVECVELAAPAAGGSKQPELSHTLDPCHSISTGYYVALRSRSSWSAGHQRIMFGCEILSEIMGPGRGFSRSSMLLEVLDWCQRRLRVNIALTDGGEALNHFLHITLTTEGTAFHRSTGEAAENRKKKKEGKEVSKEKRDPCA